MDLELSGRHLLLGITGGVAAYKSCELVRLLQQQGASVQVVMTEAGTRFVGTATFQALSGRPVYTDAWDVRVDNGMAHINLVRAADAVLIAPASADFLAKAAQGLADDLLSTLCLARDCPLLVAPAMNRQMWQHPATQRNVRQLQADGVRVLGPDSGAQACGEVGEGRMLEPEALVESLIAFFSPPLLAGRRVLLTAGPTFEPIDPVRGITNLSSGKMGYALARACQQAGAEVTLISGPTALAPPLGVRFQRVSTALEMLHAVETALRDTGADTAGGRAADTAGGQSRVDAFISVAAVADWRIANPSGSKLKKTDAGPSALASLAFEANPDILATVAARPDAPYCVGFAAESDNLLAHAQAKRRAKGVPLLVGNIGQSTFGRDDNELVLIDEHESRRLPRASKTALARELVAELARRLAVRA